MNIKPNKLNLHDNVSIIAPCFAMEQSEQIVVKESLKKLGLNPVFGKNVLKKSLGFSATAEERADDFNQAIKDDSIKMILFDGGEVSNEILPLIDYQAVINHPKIICSYSDSTSVLNAVSANTGLVTYYGQSYRSTLYSDYNTCWFTSAFFGTDIPKYLPSEEFKTIYPGKASGELIGGYLLNFALITCSSYFKFDKNKSYILFLEDNICFNGPAAVSRYLNHIAQSEFFRNVNGLLIGYYSPDKVEEFDNLISRFAAEHKLPCLKCDSFGHCDNQAIIPLGIKSTLDADSKKVIFEEAFTSD